VRAVLRCEKLVGSAHPRASRAGPGSTLRAHPWKADPWIHHHPGAAAGGASHPLRGCRTTFMGASPACVLSCGCTCGLAFPQHRLCQDL